MLDEMMIMLYNNVKAGLIPEYEIDALKGLFKDEFLTETLHGYCCRKPMGYAGDYLMIDKIYTFYMTSHPHFKKWDSYFHTNVKAAEAVRNRKDYFKKEMLQKLKEGKAGLKLLNVASGPARDLYELYQTIDPSLLNSTCVDLDARAIEYARSIFKEQADSIQFINKNALRFSTSEKFDVVWSAGLFDYFDDTVFVRVLKRFLTWLAPGGEIILGNFSEENDSRGYMELFGDWILIHRSKEELIQLAILAGAKQENVWVDQEPLGINLFLRIKNP